MGASGVNVEIVRTIVALGRNLHKLVIAEGVESQEQVAQLRARWTASTRRAITSRGRWSRRRPPRSCAPARAGSYGVGTRTWTGTLELTVELLPSLPRVLFPQQ